MLPLDSALLTVGNPAGEPLFLEVLKAAIVIRELSVKIIDRIAQVLWNCLSAVHDLFTTNIMPCILLDVKG